MPTWVVLPTYDEAANLRRMVEALLALEAGLSILVVDDDSPDGTGAVADELARAHAAVRVLHRTERGLGTAYLAGFRAALAGGAASVLTMDCDFSHEPEAVPSLIAGLAGADLVIGSRYVAGGRIEGWSLYRRLLSRAANGFVHALFHAPASDCTSGFRLYRASVVAGVPWERIRSTGYSFLVESLLWASRVGGARVREVPICFRDRRHGASKLGWREAVHGARNLLQLWREGNPR
jgi:dolichol-phosphate mannosyltransferase